MEKAQKLLKQSKKRDYYKILGVSRFDIIATTCACRTTLNEYMTVITALKLVERNSV